MPALRKEVIEIEAARVRGQVLRQDRGGDASGAKRTRNPAHLGLRAPEHGARNLLGERCKRLGRDVEDRLQVAQRGECVSTRFDRQLTSALLREGQRPEFRGWQANAIDRDPLPASGAFARGTPDRRFALEALTHRIIVRPTTVRTMKQVVTHGWSPEFALVTSLPDLSLIH